MAASRTVMWRNHNAVSSRVWGAGRRRVLTLCTLCALTKLLSPSRASARNSSCIPTCEQGKHPPLQDAVGSSENASNQAPMVSGGAKVSEDSVATVVARVTPLLRRIHALVVGPGLGRDSLMLECAARIVQAACDAELPVVLDADGTLWKHWVCLVGYR